MAQARKERAAGLGLNEPVVRAAGGVVSRSAGDSIEVLLVHRPRYDDWAFPKGKALPDRAVLAAFDDDGDAA